MVRGTHETETITLAKLPSGVEVSTTVHTYKGATSGPTLYVQAAQHGREVNGPAVLRRFHEALPLEELTGQIIAVPVANPLTFDRVSYTTPEVLDSVNQNMNRIWPGDESGSLHERMAARLWQYVSRADAVVDLHTGSPTMLPHVVFLEGDSGSRDLARAFGTDLLLSERDDDSEHREWQERDFDGKLRVVATRTGIPAITPELGHSRWIQPSIVDEGVSGLLAVCRHLGMLPGAVPDRHPTVARNHLGQVTADAAGLFWPNTALELGHDLPAGATIGEVTHPASYQILQEATTSRDGILLSLTRESTVVAGDKLATIAIVRNQAVE